MNKFRIGKYRESDAMIDLVSENFHALLVMSRFGIALGFGDKSIGEVCRENEVDIATFLAIINLMEHENTLIRSEQPTLSLTCLIDYLYHSHNYFLKFRLPAMREKLVDALNEGNDDLNKAVLGYFDKFVAALSKHTQNEDNKIFPYVQSLLKGEICDKSPVIFCKQHEQIQMRLSEFKNILIKYYPAEHANKINGFLFDIFNCENDLASHNAVEEHLFLPAIEVLENKIRKPL